MCGIAGMFSPVRIDPELLARMAGEIAHRGPDDQGVWIDQDAGVGFAHRRLAIVDLSPQGRQPMSSSDGRLTICFNGEIYNYREIREELEQSGEVPDGGWRGHSDTEVLLEAISNWGLERVLERIVGMFAFALWDRSARSLHLVRDRFGEKPLYYGWAGKDLVFGSELKALRQHPKFDGTINRQALRLYASRTYIPAPLTIYRAMFKLPPGSVLTISAEALGRPLATPPGETDHGPARLRRFWSYRDVVRSGLESPILEEGEALQELESALAIAIGGQSMADVPVGAFLSGGIDSSTVVALYQKYSSQPVRTYSIGFEEDGFDEAHHARQVAECFGTVHNEHYVTVREALDVIPQLPAIYDEPFADSSQIPTYLVSKFARRDVTVALTGDGGDELFGGYNRHLMVPRIWGHLRKVPKSVRSLAAAPFGRISPEIWSKLFRSKSPFMGARIQRGINIAGFASSSDDIYLSFLDEWTVDTNPVSSEEIASCSFDLDVGANSPDEIRMMYCDAISYLPDDILCKVDRASMAVSLETRVPFLDHRVAAVASRIATGLKFRHGQGKYILRQLLYREAPRSLFERPKAGFAVPVGNWIRGPLRDWAEDLLDPAKMAEDGWFDTARVRRRWKDHLEFRRDSTAAIWAILMFQAWLRDQRSPMALAA